MTNTPAASSHSSEDATLGSEAPLTNFVNPRDVELRVLTSRQVLELGEPWEIILQITNHSPHTLWITAVTTTLTLPAELLHPAESQVASRGAQFPTCFGDGIGFVGIKRGSSYNCTWRINENRRELDHKVGLRIAKLWDIFFHPGKYDLQINLHAWPSKPDLAKLAGPKYSGDAESLSPDARHVAGEQLSEHPDTSMRVESDSDLSGENRPSDTDDVAGPLRELKDMFGRMEAMKKEHLKINKAQIVSKSIAADVLAESLSLTTKNTIEVGIRSTTILIGSAVGGILAFVFRELYWYTKDSDKLNIKDFALLPSFVLAAVIISLLVSRLTDARLPWTIRTMDFWGAIALGIVAALGGNTILNLLLKTTMPVP